MGSRVWDEIRGSSSGQTLQRAVSQEKKNVMYLHVIGSVGKFYGLNCTPPQMHMVKPLPSLPQNVTMLVTSARCQSRGPWTILLPTNTPNKQYSQIPFMRHLETKWKAPKHWVTMNTDLLKPVKEFRISSSQSPFPWGSVIWSERDLLAPDFSPTTRGGEGLVCLSCAPPQKFDLSPVSLGG